MNTPEYTVTDLIGALSNYETGWTYKDQKNKHAFFGGEIYTVKSSNTSIPDDEVLGEIHDNQFVSVDHQYTAVITGNTKDKKAVAVNCIDGVVVILKDSIFKREGRRIQGYWYSTYEPQYPKPIPNELTQLEAKQIYDLIKIKESECEIMQFRGFSDSRIDGTSVGSKEFIHKKWLWPAGFAEHYVLKYRVKPTDDFLSFIGWKK